MKRLFLSLFFASCAYPQSHEILRPTMDTNSSTTSVGCAGTNQLSGSMSSSWDAAGLATSSSLQAIGTTTVTNYKVRIFSAWASPVQSYTALSLKVNTSGTETNFSGSAGQMVVAFSLNSGSTWNTIRSGGGLSNWTQTTDSVVLSTGQDFTKLQVAICSQGTAGGDTSGTHDTVVAWDIWTDGTYGSGGGGGIQGSSQGVPAIQPVFISEVDIRRRYASYNC